MKHAFEKKANDLQLAYDQYRGSADRLNEYTGKSNTLSSQYKQMVPTEEKVQRGLGYVGSIGTGAVGGALLGKRRGLGSTGGLLGGVAGLAAGAGASRLIRNHHDNANPERVPVRNQLKDVNKKMDNETMRFDDRQDTLLEYGKQRPEQLRSLLNPADEADSWTDTLLSNQIRQQRDAELERRRLESEHMQSGVGANQAQAGLHNAQRYQMLMQQHNQNGQGRVY